MQKIETPFIVVFEANKEFERRLILLLEVNLMMRTTQVNVLYQCHEILFYLMSIVYGFILL